MHTPKVAPAALVAAVLGLAPVPAAAWSVVGPQPSALLKGHAAPVCAATFSADGKTLVTTDSDGAIKVWDVGTGTERSTIKRFSVQVTDRVAVPVALAVSPDGGTVATALADDVPRLWNAATGRELIVLRREPEGGLALAFSPSGRLLTFLRPAGAVEFWNVHLVPDERRVRVPPQEVGRIEARDPGPKGVSGRPSLTYSPDGKVLGAVAPDRTVVVWETATGKELARITDLVVKPEAQDESRVSKEQLRALAVSRPFTLDDTGLAFSPDGRTLALGGPAITLWDVRTGRKTGALPGRAPGGFARLAFSADGNTLTSASPASSPGGAAADSVGVWVRRWDVGTGRETAAAVLRAYDADGLKRARETDRPLRPDFVAMSPDLGAMAAAGPDNSVRLWNVAAALRPVPAKPGADRER